MKIKIKKDDIVLVLTGIDKGKQGKIIKVNPVSQRVIVEGVNMVSKHTKPNAANPQGGIVKQESSIHISNLMLIDPKSGNPTKVGRMLDDKTNKLVRYSRRSGELIK